MVQHSAASTSHEEDERPGVVTCTPSARIPTLRSNSCSFARYYALRGIGLWCLARLSLFVARDRDFPLFFPFLFFSLLCFAFLFLPLPFGKFDRLERKSGSGGGKFFERNKGGKEGVKERGREIYPVVFTCRCASVAIGTIDPPEHGRALPGIVVPAWFN